jgi:WD40 repeat protein
VGIISMLFQCNILCLVGGGKTPRFSPKKVIIWDDHLSRPIGELAFRSEVKEVKLRRDRIVVVLSNKIYVYNFLTLKLVDNIETLDNPIGLCALSPSETSNVLACPGVVKGHLKVELYTTRKSQLIPAHETDLAAIALNATGSLVATASEKGTLIRVFDTATGQQLHELRRGADRAIIHCICFNINSTYLACTSDKRTAHIFSLKDDGVESRKKEEDRTAVSPSSSNKGSTFGFMKGILPKYFSSVWSFAQLRISSAKSICAFGKEPQSLVVIGADGSFCKTNFSKGGECECDSYAQFLDASVPGVETTTTTSTTSSVVSSSSMDGKLTEK